MKRFHILTALLSITLCACGRIDSPESAEMEELSAGLYRVTIPAEMYNLPVSFQPTDKIYLYDITQDLYACDQNGDAIVLHPAEFNANNTTCVLKGQVSFYRHDAGTGDWTLVPVSQTDAFRLLFNVSEANTEAPSASIFRYDGQNGTTDSARAHYYAETTEVKMNTPGHIGRFYGMQSMLDLAMTFRQGGSLVDPTLTKLELSTPHDAIALTMNAMNGDIETGTLSLSNPSATEVHLSVTFNSRDDTEVLNFIAQDDKGHFYTAAAEMPEGGFLAGATYTCRIVFDQVF